MSRSRLLRPARADDLGVRRALSDRLLPFLVASMAFLGALTVAGAVGAAALAGHWRTGAASAVTVQVPRPAEPAASGGTRVQAVLAALRGTPGVVSARALGDDELAELLRPWLGDAAQDIGLPLPAVIDLRMDDPGRLAPVARRIEAIAPGTLMEEHQTWSRRLAHLADSLLACAAVALLVVAGVAAAVIAAATRAGLAARRAAIEIVHSLGAPDGFIAGQFAGRVMRLAALGGIVGAAVAMPALLELSALAAPLAGGQGEPDAVAALPRGLWLLPPGLPLLAGAIGWAMAQITVRVWLRRLA